MIYCSGNHIAIDFAARQNAQLVATVVVQGILAHSVGTDLIVQVVAAGGTGGSHISDGLPLL